VINGGHWVSPDSLAAVEEAIRTTGYSANLHARSLVTGRSNSVAFLLTEPQHLLFEDPNFSILLRGAAEALAARRMPLLLMVAGTPDEQKQVSSYVGAGHVDGVLAISSHSGNPLLDALVRQGIPMISCGIPLGFEGRLGYVSADDLGGGRRMTRHLLDLGRTRIATITGPLDTPGGRLRLEGYRDELGSLYDDSLVAHGDYSRDGGAAGMRTLLERRPDLDAVFVASDLMASGALQVLREAGRRVPQDVAVGGFDDSGLAASLDPPLTTMRQPRAELGRLAAEDLLARMRPDALDLPPTRSRLRCELVERRSVRRISATESSGKRSRRRADDALASRGSGKAELSP
jgi:DNA-binding LacI/PurR family transcriptional regulator